MQEIFEMFFAYFCASKTDENLEISGFPITYPQHCVPRFPEYHNLCFTLSPSPHI